MISKQVIKASKRNDNLILLSFEIHLFLQIIQWLQKNIHLTSKEDKNSTKQKLRFLSVVIFLLVEIKIIL